MKTFYFFILYFAAINISLAQKVDTVIVIYEIKNVDNFNHITFPTIYESNLPKGQFKYAIDEPTPIPFYLNNNRTQRNIFFLDKDTVQLVINSSASNVQVLNSKLNNSFFLLKNIATNVDSLIASTTKKLQGAGASEEHIALFENELHKKVDEIIYAYLLKNTNSFLCLQNLKYWLSTNDIEASKLLFLYHSLDSSLYQYPTYTLCTNAINDLNKRNMYKIGDTIKKTVLKDENKQAIDLKNLLDTKKYTYLDFWSTCKFSRLAHKNLKQVVEKHKKKLTCISISGALESHEWWKNAIKEDAITWRNLRTDLGELDPVFYNFNIHTFPAGVLIDKNGVIVDLNLHPDQLESTLTKYLSK